MSLYFSIEEQRQKKWNKVWELSQSKRLVWLQVIPKIFRQYGFHIQRFKNYKISLTLRVLSSILSKRPIITLFSEPCWDLFWFLSWSWSPKVDASDMLKILNWAYVSWYVNSTQSEEPLILYQHEGMHR